MLPQPQKFWHHKCFIKGLNQRKISSTTYNKQCYIVCIEEKQLLKCFKKLSVHLPVQHKDVTLPSVPTAGYTRYYIPQEWLIVLHININHICNTTFFFDLKMCENESITYCSQKILRAPNFEDFEVFYVTSSSKFFLSQELI